jgi:hypothetical protein
VWDPVRLARKDLICGKSTSLYPLRLGCICCHIPPSRAFVSKFRLSAHGGDKPNAEHHHAGSDNFGQRKRLP